MADSYYKRIVADIREFMRLESASGLVLLAATVLALIASNSGLARYYNLFLETPVSIRIGALHLDKPLLLWINDGLMALFFLVIGAEIKRELFEGELSSWRKAALPAIAAVGGMVVPAAIYIGFNHGDSDALNGWAIPAATDIAFALAAISLLGSRIPGSLKIFLLALAIIDDLGAIVIIAVFYTSGLSLVSLLFAAAVLGIMVILNRAGVERIAPYALLGLLLWILVLKSGVHATLAGVAIAFAMPLGRPGGESPLKRLEHMLHPWTSFLVMPLFGFANAGLSFADIRLDMLAGGLAGGIALGLFLGKQLGVFAAAALAIRLGLAERPAGAGWLGLYGAGTLAGIGFTMSLFIGTLAWETGRHAAELRLGVITGSLASALCGLGVLAFASRRPGS
ncbi:MAG: Na+:H+ antiporter, NhaA family [Rhodospirillaceae bacterium]|nr:Na+:H+ antiporter, NhaA family [Rhodospirillaceae bacterium]